MTQKYFADAHEVKTIFLEPLPEYDEKKIKGKWVYEKVNPLPSNVQAIEAASCLPNVIKKNEEVIIRDKDSGKVVLAVYRNRIGPEVLNIMQGTVLEMFQLRRRVARSDGISKLNQGALAAAGYINFICLISYLSSTDSKF